jgi:hypothetical protein
MALVGGVEGVWYLAPVQAMVAFGVIMATTQRFLVRDEARHQPARGS